jgi:hypothetical protein
MRYKCQFYRRRLSGASIAAIVLLLTLLPIAWSEEIWPNSYMAMAGTGIGAMALVLMLIEMRVK